MVVACIIGGAGRMGAWFATFLKKSGYQVIVSDKNASRARDLARKHRFRFIADQIRAVRSAQLILVATPTKVTRGILEHIEPHIQHRPLIVEISSVKEPLKRTMAKLQKRGAAILSIHPMFGPGVKTLAGKVVITVTIPRENRSAQRFLSLLRKRGVKLIRSDFDEHDRLASTLLALPHFISIAMANTLRSLAIDPNRLRKAAGTTMKLHLLTAEAVCHEDFDNEISILLENRHSINTLKRFAKESTAALNTIKKGKRISILKVLSGSNSYLQKDRQFATAYRRFNAAVEASSLS